MTTLHLCIVMAAVLLIVAMVCVTILALEFNDRDDESMAPSRVGHRVTVHTKQPDDQTIFGVVVGDYRDRIALEDAEYVRASGPNQPLPGRQDIETDTIAWIDTHAHVAAPSVTVEA